MARVRKPAAPEPDEKALAAAAIVEHASQHRPVTTKTQRTARREILTDLYLNEQSKKVRDFDKVMTAAAMVMDPQKSSAGAFPTPNAVTRTWQHAAWGYVRTVPELNAAKMFVGNCLSRVKLVVGKRDPDGSVEQGFDGNEPVEGLDGALALEAAELVNQLQTPRGGQSEIMRSCGEKIFVAGELYVVPEDLPTGLTFEVFSTQELILEGGRYQRYYGPGWSMDPLPEGTHPIRIWRPDSQYQMLASSSVQSCLEVLEELVVLTRLVRASAISRMSLAGMLLIPDELDTPDDVGMDGEFSESTNPLITDMVNTGAKAIDDPASAAAWMPYILQGPTEYLKEIRHIPFQADDHENVLKRTEAVERLARGLDLPPEKVLGHMETTYANAGQISEDNFNLYIEPALQLICDALTVGYLWPALAAARGIDPDHLRDTPYPEEIMGVAITYDARKLISKPDRSKEILELYLKDLTFMSVAISEVRETVGLDPDGGPEDEEIAKRIDAYRLGRIRETIAAPAGDAAVPLDDASAGKAPVPGSSEGSRLAGHGGDAPPPADDTAAQAQEELLASAALDPLRFLSVKIAGTAELTIDRALERLGSRIRNKRGGLTDQQRAAIAGVDNSCVARVLGPEAVAHALGPNDDPTLAEIATFTRKVTAWAQQAECADVARVAGEAAAIVTRLVRVSIFEEQVTPSAEMFAEILFGVRVGVGV